MSELSPRPSSKRSLSTSQLLDLVNLITTNRLESAPARLRFLALVRRLSVGGDWKGGGGGNGKLGPSFSCLVLGIMRENGEGCVVWNAIIFSSLFFLSFFFKSDKVVLFPVCTCYEAATVPNSIPILGTQVGR